MTLEQESQSELLDAPPSGPLRRLPKFVCKLDLALYAFFTMGWGFRKSINLGPLRINASKSGLGYSVGGRGFRLGRDARGRKYSSTSIPGTGIFNRKYYSNKNQTYSPNTTPRPGLPNKSGSQLPLKQVAIYGFGALGIYLLLSVLIHLL